jgi:hypothetical protein
MLKPKRNKPYKVRTIMIPSIIPIVTASQKYPELALRLHAGLVAFTHEPTVASANALSKQLCLIAGAMSHAAGGMPILGRTDHASIAIYSAIRAFECVVERHDATEIVAVSGSEAKTLIVGSGVLDDVLRTVPAACYDRAIKELDVVFDARQRERMEWAKYERLHASSQVSA